MRKAGMIRKAPGGRRNKGTAAQRNAMQVKVKSSDRQNLNSAASAQMRMMQQNGRRDMISFKDNMSGGSAMPPPYMMSTELNNFDHLSPYAIGGGGYEPSAPIMFNSEEDGLPIILEIDHEVSDNTKVNGVPSIPEYQDFFKKIIPLKRATKYLAFVLVIITCVLVILLIVFQQFE